MVSAKHACKIQYNLLTECSTSCVKLKVKCDGASGKTCSRCLAAKRDCRYRRPVDRPACPQARVSRNESQALDEDDVSMQDGHGSTSPFASAGLSSSAVEPQQTQNQGPSDIIPDYPDNYGTVLDLVIQAYTHANTGCLCQHSQQNPLTSLPRTYLKASLAGASATLARKT